MTTRMAIWFPGFRDKFETMLRRVWRESERLAATPDELARRGKREQHRGREQRALDATERAVVVIDAADVLYQRRLIRR
jgi:hypothetical protein